MININKLVANSIVITTAPAYHADTWYKYDGDTEWRTVSITGAISGSDGTPTTQIPDVGNVIALEIGSNVTSIGSYSFYGCSSLTSVTIPNSVTNIGADAFYDCGSVNDVYCYPNPTNLTWIEADRDDFKGDDSTRCHVKAECLATYQSKFGDEVNVTFVGDLT